MRGRGVDFATITHAAGISSTGDIELDGRLPFDEPYEIPASTALAIRRARAEGRRIVAIGTTVVRALEHAGSDRGTVVDGSGLANQRIDDTSRLQVVDLVLSGVHEPGTTHHQLLRAFVDADTLQRADEAVTSLGYRSHEFGDSVLFERKRPTLAHANIDSRSAA
jgi:S-adenosylmethionine:tRNA ribosyltransferase-isomerase